MQLTLKVSPLYLWGLGYMRPIQLAANITIQALITSTYEQTLMCIIEEDVKRAYKGALDRCA